MRSAIRARRAPHFLAMEYALPLWIVRNLTFIPSFAITLSCLQKRKPLSAAARRSGWIGCNVLLGSIPPDARILVISCGVPIEPSVVRQQYARLQPLEGLGYDARGWTLDVLNVLRSFGRTEFFLEDVYVRADYLQQLHPRNQHVREKIRQQLQRLRDLGLVEFLGGGMYRMKSRESEGNSPMQ